MFFLDFHLVPISHLIFSPLCWISFILYLRLLYIIRIGRTREFKSSFFFIIRLHAITDIIMFLYVELIARPRKYRIHNLFHVAIDNWLPQLLYFSLTIIKNAMFLGYTVVALNRCTVLFKSKNHHQIWSSFVIYTMFFIEWAAPSTILIPLFYTGNHNFSLVESGNGELLLRANPDFMKLDALQDFILSTSCFIISSILYFITFFHLIQRLQSPNSSTPYFTSSRPFSVPIPPTEFIILKCAFFSFVLFVPNFIKTTVLYFATSPAVINVGTELWFFTTELMCVSSPWSLLVSSQRLREECFPRFIPIRFFRDERIHNTIHKNAFTEMSAKKRAAVAKKVAPFAGLSAAHADMLNFLSQPHGVLFDMAMQYAENAGIKKDQVAYIGISLAAVYLIFGSAARLFCNLIGFGYPMYASVKAIRTKVTEDLNMWLIYWTCFAMLLLVDFFSESIFSFFPLYYIFKALFLAYLFLPQTRGSAHFYDLLAIFDVLGAHSSSPRLATGSDAHHMMEQQTGWSDLPAEMMCEIIKHLDLKSRAQLRATARLEKAVVDANKRKVEVLVVDAFRDGLAVWMDEERFDGSIEKMTSFVRAIMKFTKVQMFQIFAASHEAKYWTAFLKNITEGGNLKFPIISLNHFDDLNFEFLFKMCAPGTELFQFFFAPKQGFKRVLQDDATKHVMLGASVIQFATNDDDFSQTNDVVEAWIRNDQTIGKKIICWIGCHIDGDELETYEGVQPIEVQVLTDFKNQFGERVVEDKEKSVRIRMDDESKHIVVRMLQEDDGKYHVVYAVWEVIRADMAEEQFEKSSGHLHIDC